MEKNLVNKKDDHLIIKALCNSCRNEDWARKNLSSGNSLYNIMKEENSRVDIIVRIDENTEWAQLQKTLSAIVQPCNVFFLVYKNEKLSNRLIKEMMSFRGNWGIKDCFDMPNRHLALLFQEAKSQYCALVKAGEIPLIKETTKIVDGHMINTELGAQLTSLGQAMEDYDFVELLKEIVCEHYKRPDLV